MQFLNEDEEKQEFTHNKQAMVLHLETNSLILPKHVYLLEKLN